ncbi:N-acetylmuramoyl-L-alanine amidase [Paraclostridium dentum]|uniref:N-acetylmuramoyl-L-alanine amidase n=1 Tax=Paraclostridium dentum TaxID=2662455 RepID=UPI003464CA83
MKVYKIIFKICLVSILIIGQNSNSYAEFENENGKNHIVDEPNSYKNGISTYVFSSYEKNGVFYLYNKEKVDLYEQASTSSKKAGSIEPQMLKASKRKGNYFYVDTNIGKKWIHMNSDMIQLREIEDFPNSKFKLESSSYIYTNPFDVFKTNKEIPRGIYNIEKKSGDWIYINDLNIDGWVRSEHGKFENTIDTLKKADVYSIPIKTKFAEISDNVRPGNSMKPKYIVIHNTANTSNGAGAKAHANLLYNKSVNGGQVSSWHYTVDDKEIYQSLPINEIGYHAGDGDGPGNRSGIAIEICENSDGNYSIAEQNASKLVAQLLYELQLPISSVKQHNDFSGKNCPARIRARNNGWNEFINSVQNEYDKLNVFKSKYYLDMYSFYGEESVLNSMKSLEVKTGWHLKYEKVKNDRDKYKIITGEFNSKEDARKYVEMLTRETGWWAKYESSDNYGKYRIIIGDFIGKSSVLNAMSQLESKYGWWSKYEITSESKDEYDTTPIYRIVTGEFNSEEDAKKYVDILARETGWWAKYEESNNYGKYRIVTGGFNGLIAVKNAMSQLESKYGWWLKYEDTGEFKYNYRIITGDFNSKELADTNANWIRETYGWHTETKKR